MNIFRYLFLMFLGVVFVHALTLQESYETKTRDINASLLLPEVVKDFTLFTYDDEKHIYRANAKEIAEIFKKHGINLSLNGAKYVTFREQSGIAIDGVKEALQKEFLAKYPTLQIKNLKVYPRSYLNTMPKNYTLKLQKQNLYQNHSTFSIITPEHMMIFFDYTLDATLDVVVSTKKIARHEQIGIQNSMVKSVQFLNFKAAPLTNSTNHQYQSKFSLKSDTILTQNDVELLSVVKRDDTVNAFIEDGRISLSFEAVALQDGKEGDTITIKKQDGKELKAKVVGTKRVEIE